MLKVVVASSLYFSKQKFSLCFGLVLNDVSVVPVLLITDCLLLSIEYAAIRFEPSS